jgi:spermidine synthase
MKPQIKLATTQTPDGGEMTLYQHDVNFEIKINGQLLMSNRQHESELALARLGCAHLPKRKAPRVLIGGLGMGYTLRQTLDMVEENAKVVVSELLAPLVDWNRDFLRNLNGQPLEDKRVEVRIGDVILLLSNSKNRFDAILLDLDNGPSAIVDSRNNILYSQAGIEICRQALRNRGCLAIWSADPSKEFEQLLMRGKFHVRRFKVPAYKASNKKTRLIWVASEDKASLPPGGSEPEPPKQRYQGR